MEDLKSLVDIKASELEEGFQLTPLREFIGTLEGYDAERDERFNRIRVILNFTDVEVIESTEPYPFPIAQLSIPYSRRRTSQWGFLTTSLEKFIPDGHISLFVGKRMHMKLIAENFGRWRGETEDRIRECWELINLLTPVESTVTPYQVALKLAEGKKVNDPESMREFYQEAFKNPLVKQDRELLQAILSQSFIGDALDRGDLTVDEDGTISLQSEL